MQVSNPHSMGIYSRWDEEKRMLAHPVASPAETPLDNMI
jgi:hypothetical protein